MLTPNADFRQYIARLLGENAGSFMDAMERPAEVSVRLNRRKSGALPSWWDTSDPVAWCPSGYYLAERPRFTFTPQTHAGLYYVQDASSMVYEALAERLLADGTLAPAAPGTPLRVLDSCAAPGGKTTAVINALPDDAQIVANEFVASRANILKENLMKWGFPNVVVTNSPVKVFGKLRGMFDLVIADVPCSGEGMMRKSEDAVEQWSEGLVRQCVALQREILGDLLPALRPGGCLIYSTCTFNRREDEEQVDWLVNEYDLEVVTPRLPAEWGVGGAIDSEHRCLRFMPHLTRGEGLFVCVLRKKGDASPTPKLQEKRLGGSKPVRDKALAEAAEWLESASGFDMEVHGSSVVAVPRPLTPLLAQVRGVANVRGAGIEAGELKGGKLLPGVGLALSTALRPDAFPRVELSEEEAVRYLSREALTLPAEAPRGNVIVTYGGLPLGFVKNLGNRANNNYPHEWRIKTAR